MSIPGSLKLHILLSFLYRTLSIPSSIAPGTYYLGFILDPNNAVSEANESNGFQEMPRAIVIY